MPTGCGVWQRPPEREIALNIPNIEPKRPLRRLGWRLLSAISGTALIGAVMFANMAVVFAAGPAVNLDQCRNGGLVKTGTQTSIQCSGGGSGNSGWVNGNAGASNAHYAEGESISYRARITGLAVNDQVVVVMGYDVVHSGRHAIDFLTDKNRWQSPETTVTATPDQPCSGVTGCVDPTDQKLAPIPAPTTNVQVDVTKTLSNGCEVTGSGATQQPVTSFNTIAGAGQAQMEFFDATPAVSNAIQYVGPTPNLLDRNGDQEQQISVTFTANATSPVLAWGGHIARSADWGCVGAPQSASGISGSPYHMRIKNITVNGTPISLGNQDRSLSAAAVVVLQPTLPTTPSPSSGPIGTVLNDSATITGGSSPTGTVTFNLYGPGDTTCTGTALFTQTVAVSGGVASTTGGYTTTIAGTYNWTAHYSGDNGNLPADSGCGSEAVTIAKSSPTLPTTPSPASGSIGAVLNDSATVSGGSNPTGSVTFNLYGPGDTTCTGTILFTQTVTLSGGTAATTGGYTTTQAGTFNWTAHYGGDSNNNSADSVCGSEAVVIGKNSPLATTAQSLIPNDTLTITGATSNASGTVDFYLFAPNVNCALADIANAAFTQEDVALVGNDHAATSNTGTGAGMYLATTQGTYHWLAIYSGDGNNSSATSNCVETFSIDNDINNP
jgi:hypothetical protein